MAHRLFPPYTRAMKTYHSKKGLTFGDYVASVYKTSSKRQARAMIQLAVNAHLVNFLGRDHFVISNRRGQDEYTP